MKTKFDKDEEKPKIIINDILGTTIKVGDYVACADGGYRGSKYMSIGTVIKINGKSVKVKKERCSYDDECNIAGNKVIIINEKRDVQI